MRGVVAFLLAVWAWTPAQAHDNDMLAVPDVVLQGVRFEVTAQAPQLRDGSMLTLALGTETYEGLVAERPSLGDPVLADDRRRGRDHLQERLHRGHRPR